MAASPTPGTPGAARRQRRWARPLAVTLVGLLALPFVGLWLGLAAINGPAMKARVRQGLREQLGLDIQYGRLRLSPLAGLRLDDLRVLTPPPYDAVEPVLLRIGALEVTWSPRRLLGDGPLLDEIALRDTLLTVVADEQGDSLGRLLARLKSAPPTTQPPPGPRSRRLEAALPARPPVGRLLIDGLSLAYVRGGARSELRGLRLGGELRRGPGGLEADLAAGTPTAPLDLRLRHSEATPGRGGAARAQLHLGATVRAGAETHLQAAAGLKLLRQDLLPGLPSGELLALSLRARSLPAERRLVLALERLTLLGGMLEAALEAEVPDDAAELRVGRASGRLDLRRLPALLPAALGRLTLREGQLRLTAAGLVLGRAFRLAPGGALQADGQVADLELRPGAGGGPHVLLRRLDLRAQGSLAGEETRLRLELPLLGLRIERPDQALWADGLWLTAEAARAPGGPPRLRLSLPAALLGLEERRQRHEVRDLRAELRATLHDAGRADLDLDLGAASLHGPPLSLRRARLLASVQGAQYNAAEPLGSRGDLRLRGRVATLSLGRAGTQVGAQDLGLELTSRLSGSPPYQLEAHVPVGRLSARRGGRPLLPASPGRLDLTVTDLRPGTPAEATRGSLRAAASLGGLRLLATVDKGEASAELQLTARADSLALLRLLLPEADAPWERTSLSLESRATVSNLLGGAPHLSQRSELRLGGVVLPGGGARADGLRATLTSRGTARRQEATADLRLQGLLVRGHRLGDSEVAGSLEIDRSGRAAPLLRLDLKGQGSAGPEGRLRLALDLSRPERALRYDADVHLDRLAVLEALLPAALQRQHRVAWPHLRVALAARGTARGVVRGLTPDGLPRFVPAPDAPRALRGEQKLRLAVHDLRYEGGGRRVELPELDLSAQLDFEDEGVRGEASAALPRLRLIVGDQELEVRGLAPELKLARGDLRTGAGQLDAAVRVGAVTGRGLSGYPVGEATLSAQVQRGEAGTVRITQLRLHNPRGGTRLQAEGGLDLTRPGAATWPGDGTGGGAGSSDRPPEPLTERVIVGRQSLELRGTLEQDVARLGLLRGAGRAALEFRLESPDLRLMHARGTLRLDGVHLRGNGYAVAGARGQVPIAQDLVLGPDGSVAPVGSVRPNAYPRLRFQDHQPFLRNASYLAADRLEVAGVQLGQLAGNVRLDHNLLTIDQLETRLRGGVVTGQLSVEHGADSEVRFRGAVTGLRPSRDDGERLDASGALRFGLRRRTVEGRAEIARIGRRHLLDLLDLLDPFKESVGLNRVRRALGFGHPEQVRLLFDGGFVALAVRLGGLGRGVRIDEVRGVPVGPLVERFLGEMLRKWEK